MFGKELAALMAMKAMTDPGDDIEEQVNKTLSKKIRVADRSRPHVIQLWTAFQRTVQWRRSKGEKKTIANGHGTGHQKLQHADACEAACHDR